jgi:hypothetical protein
MEGMERKEGELGWKIEGERLRYKGRIMAEGRSHGSELGDGGQLPFVEGPLPFMNMLVCLANWRS